MLDLTFEQNMVQPVMSGEEKGIIFLQAFQTTPADQCLSKWMSFSRARRCMRVRCTDTNFCGSSDEDVLINAAVVGQHMVFGSFLWFWHKLHQISCTYRGPSG